MEKAKLTARRIYDLLKEKHGEVEFSCHTVNRYVNKYKKEINCGVMKRFDRLYWSPTEAQADFGEADFIINNNEIKRYKYFVLSFPYSNKVFTQIYSGENCECVCQALMNKRAHYIKKMPGNELFDESRSKLSDLPAKAFVARRVLKYKANGYNEIILEAKHVYTLSKLYRNEYVTVVTTAWKVDVYNI